VTSIRMFYPDGKPVEKFDLVVDGYLPKILEPGK
jgi:hypothetical protein